MLDEDDFIATTPYAVLSGLVLGTVIVFPFYLGLFEYQPWVQAWLAVILNIFLTRGLHYDGLSDVADAAGNHLQKERFWEIIKDSRIGAFGVMALICVVVGQVILYREFFLNQAYFYLLWLFPFSRFSGIFFSFLARKYVRPVGSGRPFYLGATLVNLLFAGALVFLPALFFLPWQYVIATLGFACFGYLPFLRTVRIVDGANGDFIGCAMLVGEIAAGLGFCMFMQFYPLGF